jgi:hypothetical protein
VIFVSYNLAVIVAVIISTVVPVIAAAIRAVVTVVAIGAPIIAVRVIVAIIAVAIIRIGAIHTAGQTDCGQNGTRRDHFFHHTPPHPIARVKSQRLVAL